MTAWLSFAMWLTLMPCGCRSGGGLKCAPRGPKRAKKKCVPTTFLKTAVNRVVHTTRYMTAIVVVRVWNRRTDSPYWSLGFLQFGVIPQLGIPQSYMSNLSQLYTMSYWHFLMGSLIFKLCWPNQSERNSILNDVMPEIWGRSQSQRGKPRKQLADAISRLLYGWFTKGPKRHHQYFQVTFTYSLIVSGNTHDLAFRIDKHKERRLSHGLWPTSYTYTPYTPRDPP